MIINHTHRFIFIHIPKNAGTTSAHLFSRFTSYRDLEVGATKIGEAMQRDYYTRFGLQKHSTTEAIRRVVGDDTWSSYFKFAFVRHPEPRAVSTYKFLRRWRLWKGSDIMDKFHTVNDFIASDYWKTDGVGAILAPQVKYLTEEVDYVGRVETFDACIDHVVEKIGLPPIKDRRVDFKNESDRAPVSLDDRSRDLIFNRYRADFDAFGYAAIHA
jgi:hypothetical protein